ncbi:enoyl-CoA hydratase/isomerase family protein [Castellaniella sp. GW247-6E4]|uniref:enoyl-CoA hydratase/isomerase family protein n=1 Tax=Castellaniella sp. GW247-6E4 TaxID=3140380 RepID=UPI003314A933
MNDLIVFEELEAASNHRIGLATLNSPQTLNGVSLAMCEQLDARLRAWQDDPSIAAVLLDGAGGKAFCAGGDLHSLYRAMLENKSGEAWGNPYARRFFEVEYRLDFLIHRYRKPLLCWGNGIVMGGGVGLMMGASHRIVTETTRFAMPEVAIGLYPDVAGTWMLSHLPRGIGVFLALTGAQLGASDCLRLGLADRACRSTGLEALRAALAATSWSTDVEARAGQVDRLIDGLPDPEPLVPGPLQIHFDAIRAACDRADFAEVCAGIRAWTGHEDPWLARAAATFAAGSPGSARLSHTLIERMRPLSLADVFREEYIISLHCTAEDDFQEGIRALLIDKDKSPRWRPATHEQADARWVERFFRRPWPEGQPHPLADLQA